MHDFLFWCFVPIPTAAGEVDMPVGVQALVLALCTGVAGGLVHLLTSRACGCGVTLGALRYIPPAHGRLQARARRCGALALKAAALGLLLGPFVSVWNFFLDRYLPLYRGDVVWHAFVTILLDCVLLNPFLASMTAVWHDVCHGRRAEYASVPQYVMDEVMPAMTISFWVWPVVTLFEPLVSVAYTDAYETAAWFV
eukprot:EG_transcript_31598